MDYAILLHPGHSRVYFAEAPRLAAAELEAMAGGFSGAVSGVAHQRLAGVDYLTFSAGAPLAEAERRAIGRSSFACALFELERIAVAGAAEGKTLLSPVEMGPESPFAGIGGMLKYRGKTNERFTRLLINLALCAGGCAAGQPAALLDPLCGKGTTLFEAAELGLDAFGVELAPTPAAEAARFFRQYLERGRFKHSLREDRVGTPAGRAQRWRFEYAASREAYKQGDTRRLEIAAGDSQHTGLFFGKQRFDVLVCDLPYGVQHGNVSGERQTALTRSPAPLLAQCLPAWHKVLKKGAGVAVGWNTLVLSRAEAARLFAAAGFEVLAGPPWEGLEHRVEQAIVRDVLVARRA